MTTQKSPPSEAQREITAQLTVLHHVLIFCRRKEAASSRTPSLWSSPQRQLPLHRISEDKWAKARLLLQYETLSSQTSADMSLDPRTSMSLRIHPPSRRGFIRLKPCFQKTSDNCEPGKPSVPLSARTLLRKEPCEAAHCVSVRCSSLGNMEDP